jgi:hypothetical protein
MTGNSAINHFKANQFTGNTFRFLFFQHRTVDKILALHKLSDPSQSGFYRRSRIIQIIAIQTEAHFQPERITGTQTDRFNAILFTSFKNSLPYRISRRRIEIKLKTSRTGITRIGDNHILFTCKRSNLKCIIRNSSKINIRQLLQNRNSLRTLYSKLSYVIRRIFQLGSLRIVRNTPVPVFFHIGSIHHQHVFFRFILINQQIIYNPPILIRKTSILYFTRSQCRHIVRCYFLQKGQRLRSFHPKFSHVRYIKYTDTLTNSYVFINDAGVFNRHIITCKLVHFSTKCYMFLCKRSGFHYFKVLSFKYQVLSITGAYRLFIWKPPVLLFLRSLSLLSPYSG